MSENKNKNKETVTAAEFPDDAGFEVGADFSVHDHFNVIDGDPGMRYYLAANDDDSGRPDGVAQVKLRGYRESDKQIVGGSSDCKLMEIPRRVFDAREKRKLEARQARSKAAARVPGIPDGALVRKEDVDDRPGAGDFE